MFRILLYCAVFTGLLTGCVQRSSYENSGKSVQKNRINTVEAAKTRIALGLQYLKVGEMSNAKFNLEKAKGFAPQMPAVHTAFAYYYQKVAENELAEQAYRKALSIDAQNADALNNYGTFLCKMKRYEEAEATLLKAIHVPTYLQVAQSYENAALCAMENKQYDKAKNFFTQSLEHNALRANTLVSVAGLSYAMGEYKDAQKYTQRLSNVGVISPRVLLLSALTELKLGNVTQSKKHGTTLVSMYVKSPESLMYLSKNFENSEFEQLRRLYLKHQYELFKQQHSEGNNRSNKGLVKKKLKKILKPKTPAQQVAHQAVKPTPTVLLTSRSKASQEHRREPQTSVAAKASVKQQTSVKILEVPFHRVKAGEGVYDISIEYNIKMKRLLQWNQLSEKAHLRVGQKVFLNNPNIYHTIAQGETLYGLALKYKILVDKLMLWNDLPRNARLAPGRKILIVNPERYFL